jgi:hypothetical protein
MSRIWTTSAIGSIADKYGGYTLAGYSYSLGKGVISW